VGARRPSRCASCSGARLISAFCCPTLPQQRFSAEVQESGRFLGNEVWDLTLCGDPRALATKPAPVIPHRATNKGPTEVALCSFGFGELRA
jgi:hypothetical protein